MSLSKKFSEYLLYYKKMNKFKTWNESIIDLIEKQVFDFITYSNIKTFLNKSIKNELYKEFDKNNMIKKDE